MDVGGRIFCMVFVEIFAGKAVDGVYEEKGKKEQTAANQHCIG